MPPHEGSQTTHVPSLVFLQWALLYALGDHHEQRQHLAGAEQVPHPPTASPHPRIPLPPAASPLVASLLLSLADFLPLLPSSWQLPDGLRSGTWCPASTSWPSWSLGLCLCFPPVH